MIPFRYTALFLVLILLHCVTIAQEKDSTRVKEPFNFGATVTLTTKGISSIPNLTLGKPAAIVYLSMGRAIKFEPELRWGLNGKPWMFIFWFRYDLVNRDHFFVKLRVNPTVLFNTITVTTNNVTSDIMKASRTLTLDLAPNLLLTKKFSIGPYWMYSYGVEKNAIKNTNLIGLRANLTNVKLSDQYAFRFTSMAYFLKMDADHGYYFNSTLALSKKNCPFSASVLINKVIQTEVPVGEDFLWNVSLIYTFNKLYRTIEGK
jgi:hypothetical protein